VSGADPGELEGYWVTGSKIYRFVKQGDEYVGSLEHVPSSAGQSGIRKGDQIFRLIRVSPNLYKGTYQQHVVSDLVAGSRVGKNVDQQVPVWVSTLGVVAFTWGPGASVAYLAPAGFISSSRVQAETLGAPDYYDGWGLVRVQNPGNWTLPSGRRVRLASEDPPGIIWSHYLFPGAGLTGEPVWYLASGKSPAGKPVFIMYPDYDRAIAEGKQVREHSGARKDDFRIDNMSREYLTRGGFSTIFGPASVSECQKALGEYPQDITGVRR